MSRSKRRNLAAETLKILEQGYFETPEGIEIDIAIVQKKAVDQTITYAPDESDKFLKNRILGQQKYKTQIEVTGETTLNATRRLIEEGRSQVLCLNFASAKNPGGGFLGGSQAQEESIARATGLYPSLLNAKDYYQTNRQTKSCFYTDYMIYSPDVPIIKDEAGNNLSTLMTASVITAPAVNTGVVKRREQGRLGEIETVMKRRMAKVLTIALHHGHRNVVLGAWGCGVFQNNPEEIAVYFQEVIEQQFKEEFECIVFAIYAKNERFIRPFKQAFLVEAH